MFITAFCNKLTNIVMTAFDCPFERTSGYLAHMSLGISVPVSEKERYSLNVSDSSFT